MIARAITRYLARNLIDALDTYARTKRVDRDWSPTRMLLIAEQITGKPYKRGEYDLAIEDLQGWLSDAKRAR